MRFISNIQLFEEEDKPYIDAHRSGDTVIIDMMHIPTEMRGQGRGRVFYNEWEKSLPSNVRYVKLWACDAGDGHSRGFWDRVGFEAMSIPEKYWNPPDKLSDSWDWMIKGVNGNPTPEPTVYTEKDYLDDYGFSESSSKFISLFETPEYAQWADGNRNIDFHYEESDAMAFGIDKQGVVSIGGEKDVPKKWTCPTTLDHSGFHAMTHHRLYGVSVAGDSENDPHEDVPNAPTYKPRLYWEHLGRAWHRGGLLFMSFWGDQPPDDVVIKIASALRGRRRDRNIKVQWGGMRKDEWVDLGGTRDVSVEQKKLAELEHLLHTADPSQKPFIRKGIALARAKIGGAK